MLSIEGTKKVGIDDPPTHWNSTTTIEANRNRIRPNVDELTRVIQLKGHADGRQKHRQHVNQSELDKYRLHTSHRDHPWTRLEGWHQRSTGIETNSLVDES